MWSCLPMHLISKILNYIESRADLTQCRRVCKAWTLPADGILLGGQIMLSHNKDMLKLYKFLCGNPERSKLIKHIVVGPSLQNYVLCETVRLVFLPNIEKFEGHLAGHGEDVLFEINAAFHHNSSNLSEFKGLVSLPTPQKFTIMYFNTLLKFKKTLQSIVLNLSNDIYLLEQAYIMSHLDGFEALSLLELKLHVCNITELDNYLQHFAQLQELKLDLRTDQYCIMPKDRVQEWISKKKVSVVQGLEVLKFTGFCFGDITEYIHFKYPNISTVDAFAYSSNLDNFLSPTHIERIIDTLVKMKFCKARLWSSGEALNDANLHDNKTLGNVANYIVCTINNILIKSGNKENNKLSYNVEQDFIEWIKSPQVDRQPFPNA